MGRYQRDLELQIQAKKKAKVPCHPNTTLSTLITPYYHSLNPVAF